MEKEVVLTGLRSNSEFHIGNYLGAILPVVALQKKHAGKFRINMFIPDLHSFTTPIDHDSLYKQSLENLKIFVAAGLDLNNPDTFIYRQSYIAAHTELTWILSCFTGFGELGRMTEFKTKNSQMISKYNSLSSAGKLSAQQIMDWQYVFKNNLYVSAGLFLYPVLMAADILLYGAKWIPVGEDQRQHIEFTRDLAIRMNNKFNKFGQLFVVPEENKKQLEFIDRQMPVRIRSLKNPENKMSKSLNDPAGTITLSESPEAAAKKIMSATTDSFENIKLDWEKQPGVSNLLQILSLLSNRGMDEIKSQWEGQTNYVDLKAAVAGSVKEFLTNLQSKAAKVNEAELVGRLEAGEQTMTEVAKDTLSRVQKAVGLRPKL